MVDKVELGLGTLKGMGVNGHVGFSVKAKDTDHNRSIVEAFLNFAKTECADNYTLAIKRLLESYQNDYKHELLYDEIERLKKELRESKKENKDDEDEVF